MTATELKPLVVSIKTACELLQISRSQLYRLFETGEVRRLRVDGSAIRIPVGDLESFIQSKLNAEKGEAW